MKYAEIAELLCKVWTRRSGEQARCAVGKTWTDSRGRQWWTAVFEIGGIEIYSGSDPDPDLAWKALLSSYCRSNAVYPGNLSVRARSIEELALKLELISPDR